MSNSDGVGLVKHLAPRDGASSGFPVRSAAWAAVERCGWEMWAGGLAARGFGPRTVTVSPRTELSLPS